MNALYIGIFHTQLLFLQAIQRMLFVASKQTKAKFNLIIYDLCIVYFTCHLCMLCKLFKLREAKVENKEKYMKY